MDSQNGHQSVLQELYKSFLLRSLSRNPLLSWNPRGARASTVDIGAYMVGEALASNTSLDQNRVQESVYNEANLVFSKPSFFKKFLVWESVGLLESSPKNTFESVRKKITNLQKDGREIFYSRGFLSLTIGFPMVMLPKKWDQKYAMSPVFLWEVVVKVDNNHNIIHLQRVGADFWEMFPTFRDDANPDTVSVWFLNPILEAYLSQEYTLSIGDEDADDEKDIWNSYDEIVALAEKKLADIPWITFANDERQSDERFDQNPQDATMFSGVFLWKNTFHKREIFHDLKRLASRSDTINESVLRYFLWDNKPEDAAVPAPGEKERYIVRDADPTQMQSIWQSRTSEVLCIQWPPGTGKTQTIINIAADAIKNRQKVLIVSEQPAALKILVDRLWQDGLGDYIAYIPDIYKSRKSVLKSIQDIDRDPTIPFSQKSFEEISSEIETRESKLDAHISFLYAAIDPDDDGTDPRYRHIPLVYRNIYAKAEILKRELDPQQQKIANLDVISDCKNRSDAHSLFELIEEFQKQYIDCRYHENPWRYYAISADLQRSDRRKITDALENLWQQSQNTTECIRQYQQHPLFAFRDIRLVWLVHGNFHAVFDEMSQLFEILSKETSTVSYADEFIVFFDRLPALKEQLENIKDIAEIQRRIQKNEVCRILCEEWSDCPKLWSVMIQFAVYEKWRDALERQHERCVFRNPKEFQKEREQLKKQMGQKLELVKKAIGSHYTQRLWPQDDLKRKKCLAIRESKRRKRTELRELYRKWREEMFSLYPILITTTTGAAALLPLESECVDIIIFDEASQLFADEAAPLLYRAKRTVIVGDRMQMPPYTGFMQQESEEYGGQEEDKEYRAIEGGESLVEAGDKAVMTGSQNSQMLQVHYRSHHRELIDFSNHAFYDGKLFVPPTNTPINPHLQKLLTAPITVCRVDSPCADSTNIGEIEKILSILETHFLPLSPSECPSIGILTLNKKQKDMIEDQIDERMKENEKFCNFIERIRDPWGKDPLIIRNVRNIQGDERDIIIMSTIYDDRGQRRYGEVNISEKWRRFLNVAITRAREALILVSSLSPEHVANENERDNDKERYFLAAFLKYARSVSAWETQTARNILRGLYNREGPSQCEHWPDSPFEEDVANSLKERWYIVEYQIAESGFRIDLWIKSNQSDFVYLCWIECDGKTYHSWWRARHNDIWRQEILESKWWKIIRVWSEDWFDNRNTILDQLCRDIDDCKTEI